MTSSYGYGTPKRSSGYLGNPGQIIKCGRLANIIQRWIMNRSPHIGHFLHKHTKYTIDGLSLPIQLLYKINSNLHVGEAPELWEKPNVFRCGHGRITWNWCAWRVHIITTCPTNNILQPNSITKINHITLKIIMTGNPFNIWFYLCSQWVPKWNS